MKSPPFAISSQALAMIEETFRVAAKHPEVARMVPALCFGFGSQRRTKGGRIFEWIGVGHFLIGWHRAGQVTGWTRFDLLGREVAFSTDVLKRLKGKKLVVRTVESGYPNRSAKKVRLLRAVPIST
jgi:hypothetical protein